jgi:hypothetical protein
MLHGRMKIKCGKQSNLKLTIRASLREFQSVAAFGRKPPSEK